MFTVVTAAFLGGRMKRFILMISGALLLSSSGAMAQKADNSIQNRGESITAEKQPNDKSDVKALANIRRSIVHEKGLSMGAKNVKILFSNGTATLIGPVANDDEKSRVEQIVKKCSCVTAVDNQMTVKN